MGIARSSPILARGHIYSNVGGFAFQDKEDGTARKNIRTHVHTIAYITRMFQSALASLARGSAPAFRKYHSSWLFVLRCSLCARCLFSPARVSRLANRAHPKFVRGPTFERSSVKKSAMPLENYVPVYLDILSSFYYVLVCNRWVSWKGLHAIRGVRDMLREFRCGG